MDDIDKLEIDMLAKWIIQQGIPSQGPLIAAALLKTAGKLRDKAHKIKDHDVRHLINRYAHCYARVGMIEGAIAGGVINLLRDLVEEDKIT